MTVGRRVPAIRAALATALALTLALSASAADWVDVLEADAELDLRRAEERALATVARDPLSPDAVVVAGWWSGSSDVLAEPEALLSAGGARRDPELGFLLERLDAELDGRPPAGTLVPVELSGPWGVFDSLDLERDVVPADDRLPPLPTVWRAPAGPFRLRLEPARGWAEPPRALVAAGVYLAAWTLDAAQDLDGWLVVEASGSLDVELNGRPVASLRHCGVVDPAESWFRVRLAAGQHRLRVAMASQEVPAVRLSLLDDDGAPLAGVQVTDAVSRGPGADSQAVPREPPAADRLWSSLAAGGSLREDGLLAVALARGRGDPRRERRVLERLLDAHPDDPLVHLETARHHLMGATGADRQEDLRRVREHLRRCQSLPLSALMERVVAVSQRRPDDAERILKDLVEAHGGDPRVAQLWIRHALERGWMRDAEEAVEPLAASLPWSREVVGLRLEVLERLERWRERTDLLLELADDAPPSLELADQLAAACRRDAAIGVLQRLDERADDPSIGAATVRLLLADGRAAEAAERLDAALARWGDVSLLEPLRLALAAESGDGLERALASALQRSPADLGLRTLAWERGLEPFWQPFRVDALSLAAERPATADGVDAELLLDQAVERVYPDGSSIYYYHGLSRALTPAGAAQVARLQLMPGAVLLDVKIHKEDGTVVVPPELPGVGAGLELTHVEPGDMVEEEYVSALAGIGGSRRGHLSPYVYRFADSERAFGLSEYVLLVPPEVEVKVDGRRVGLDEETGMVGGLRLLRWRAEKVTPIPEEPFSPPSQEHLPWVTYGFGVSWQDVGDAVRVRMLDVLLGSVELEEWAEPLLAVQPLEVMLTGLMRALVEEVDPGRSQLDLGATAGESFSREVGNRLAILAHLLLETGLQVDLVLARPLPLAGSHLEVPTMEAFGDPLLRVARGDDVVWVDVDEEVQGVGHIAPLVQASDGLVVPLDDPRRQVRYLERLPVFPNPELEDSRRLEVLLDAGGDAAVELDLELRGAPAKRLWEQVEGLPEERRHLLYVQVAVGLLPGAENVRGLAERADGKVSLRLDLDLPGACEEGEARMLCRSLVVHRPLVPALASLPERRFPLVLQLPISQRRELVLHPPPGWTVSRPPRLLETPWGTVREELEVTAASVHSLLRLDIPAQVVPPEDYPAFARFCHAVDELMSRPPELVPAE